MRRPSRHVSALPFFLLGLLLLAACTDRRAAPDAATAADDDSTIASLPETKADTLYLEGQAEPVTLHLFDEPGAPFITYAPEASFVGEVSSSGEGIAVSFHTNFAGQENQAAYLHFFFPAPEQGLRSPAALARQLEAEGGLLSTSGWRVTRRDTTRGARPCPWAAIRYRFSDPQSPDDGTGYACVGRHGGEPFYLMTRRPAAYGDGFGPRAALLLDELRWRDTGQGLRAE